MSAGRPSLYNKQICDLICAQLAEGASLRSICEHPDLPSKTSVLTWLNDSTKKEFLVQYEAARKIQLEVKADELEDLAAQAAGTADNMVAIARARLVVDTRKFVLAKLMPKKYGDFVEPAADVPAPVTSLDNLTVEERAQYLALRRKMNPNP